MFGLLAAFVDPAALAVLFGWELWQAIRL